MIHQMNLMISPMMNSTPIRPTNPPPPLLDSYRRLLIAASDPTKTIDSSPWNPYRRPRVQRKCASGLTISVLPACTDGVMLVLVSIPWRLEGFQRDNPDVKLGCRRY